ncbi:2Fe-2S iron-sulfur cluster binding domain-containing protein [Burkholderia sp. AU31624]|uniref:2Fe-2S iron-sulfur cluster-binding protein n=1 Tax=unclassified Burkholderia TaxID=2613784 RepID=UPI00117EDB82|nr:2Fe-2S iron-sulfur cluster binding domain-containing protein [Burkholderia sp. AU38729]MCA8253571.1 2Fe-2S iron-sulfur cluster binding domain-containing protein [Burkholderia sp. AU31624]
MSSDASVCPATTQTIARAIYSAPRSPYPAGCRGRRVCATCAARTASTTIRNGTPSHDNQDRSGGARARRMQRPV